MTANRVVCYYCAEMGMPPKMKGGVGDSELESMAISRRKKKFRRLRDAGKWLAVWLVPPVYKLYMWLVYHTSKEVYSDLHKVWDAAARGENVLVAGWHQNAILGPFLGRGRDVVAMVSRGDLGNVGAEMIRKLHFIPVRGGSGNRGKEALAEMIEYINKRAGVVSAMAVDGSRGPARKAQIGVVLMAQATGAPIYPLRLWAKRLLFAPTWDKTAFPLPFNRLVFVVGDPIHVSPDADRQTLEGHRAELERSLNELALRAENFFRKGAVKPEKDRADA